MKVSCLICLSLAVTDLTKVQEPMVKVSHRLTRGNEAICAAHFGYRFKSNVFAEPD